MRITVDEVGMDRARIRKLAKGYNHCPLEVRFLANSGGRYYGRYRLFPYYSPLYKGHAHLITVKVPTDENKYPISYYQRDGPNLHTENPQMLAEAIFLHELYHHIRHDHWKHSSSTRKQHKAAARFVVQRMGGITTIPRSGTIPL